MTQQSYEILKSLSMNPSSMSWRRRGFHTRSARPRLPRSGRPVGDGSHRSFCLMACSLSTLMHLLIGVAPQVMQLVSEL